MSYPGRVALLDQADQVALAVAHERHPLVGPGRAEGASPLWLKITCGSPSIGTPAARNRSTVASMSSTLT